DIEDGEGIKSFENREQTLVDSKILYSKIKVSSNLHSVEEILKLVDQNIVPQSYQKANTAYINAKFTINKFPDDEKIIKEKTREALDEALYAQTIEMESKKLIGLEENVELFVRDQHEKLNIIFTSLDNKNQKFKTLSYSSKISKLRNDILKIIDDRKSLKSKNKNLISNANINKKTIVDLDERVEQQTLKINSLEAKVQNSNEQLLKSKDGALDANTKLIELQNEITLLKATVDKEKKSTQDRDKIILDSKETISKLNQKINTTNNKLKKELKNSSKLSDALEDKELIIKALKSKNKNLIAKSEKEVVKEVVKETTTEE
ncbi:MAG: hypothetical protein U9O83_07255, partial [Campylobacterota bacterium]|nr:hypothetical protein [Campylobacterota bacterium]